MRDSCEGGGSPYRAEFVKYTGRWWGAEERGFTIFPVKTSPRDGSISSHSLDGRSASVLKRHQSPQLHPWRFSSIKSCRVLDGVLFLPSAATSGYSSAHQLCWTDTSQPPFLLLGLALGTGGWRSCCCCCCWSRGHPDTPQPSSRPPHWLAQLWPPGIFLLYWTLLVKHRVG